MENRETEQEKRNVRFEILLSETEKAEWDKGAKILGVTLSDFIRLQVNQALRRYKRD